MTDTLTPQKRSWNMSRIRSSDTKPELVLRSVLHRLGFRFRINQRNLPGRPDIVLSKYKTVVFVHGCFWHQHPGCKDAKRPKTNTDYWTVKLDGNVKRDEKNRQALLSKGWRVLRYWECEIEKDPISIGKQIEIELRGDMHNQGESAMPSRSELLRSAEIRARGGKRRKKK